MCKFPIFLPFIISFVYHYVQVLLLFTFHYMFSVPFWASSLSIYIPLDLQCPILGKFPIYLHSIISSVSHCGQVPNNFVLHYIFSVPLCASSLSFYLSLFPLCTIMCKFSFFLPFIICSVSHSGQVPYLFTFHQIFSVPLCASSLSIYISLYLQCPIRGKFPIYLHSIRSSVSHYVHVPYLFTFHYIFSFPSCASSLTSYVSLYLQCPILGKYPILLRFIISSVSHYVQVLHIFTFHSIFSVPFCASSLTSYVSLYLQCPIVGKYPIILCFIIYLVSHYVQVPYLFTFHQIFSVPLCACSLSFYLSLYLQFPIMCKFPNFLCFVISSVSHSGQVPYSFTFHYIFSVPLCASSPYFYISFHIQCPILCKFPNFLCFVISSVSHSGQVPNNFVLHYIFSVPLCASSLSFYLSLFPLCTIMCKFSFFLPFIICSVSHYVQVPFLFTFHQIFSVPFWASSLSIYIPLDLQCPILGKFPIYLHFIISLVSHLGQVPYLFTFHQIFSVPLCACSLSFYLSLYLQFPIMCKFPNFLCFVISSVSHSGQVPYSFTFHYIFSVPLCASSPYFYISFHIQCPILCKFPNFLCFVISSVSHSGQVPNNFVLHYIFSVPLCASSLSFYLSLFPLCTIMCKFSFFLPFIICSVSHYVQVPYLFTFHQIFSVPFWASSLSIYIPLDLQCPIMCKFPSFYLSLFPLCTIMCKFSYLFTFHYIFSVPFCASSLQLYVSLFLQCPIMCQFSIFLHFILYLVSHYVQVPKLLMFPDIFSVLLCASSLLLLHFIIFLMVSLLATTLSLCLISSACHYVQVPYLFTFHQIFSVPLWASSQ